MSRKMTAGQLTQIGQHLVNGLGQTPNREELQIVLGNADVMAALNEAGRTILGPALTSARSTATPSVAAVTNLLELIKRVQLPAVEAFSAKRCFVTRNTPDGVKLGWVGDNFTRVFLNGAGHNEIDVPASERRIHRLRKWSKDEPIVKELGGEQVAETHLAHMWEMMKRQGQGQQGDLLVNGYANIFYIRASDGTLWTVYCYWNAYYGRWRVGAAPITLPLEWSGGFQVVSC